MIDRTRKRDNRDKARDKRWRISGRSLEHVVNAIRKRGKRGRHATTSAT